MFHRQLCIRVDCAPGVNMLQLLANRTSKGGGGVWKGGSMCSTLTYNVTLLPRWWRLFPSIPPLPLFTRPSSTSPRGEGKDEDGHVEMKFLERDGPRHTALTATFLLGSRIISLSDIIGWPLSPIYFSINPERGSRGAHGQWNSRRIVPRRLNCDSNRGMGLACVPNDLFRRKCGICVNHRYLSAV